jgi:hypothetical protein
VRRFECDPRVAALLFFHWVDETDRDRFQSGAIRADDTEKPVVDAVKGAIDAGCTGAAVAWRHSTTVDGATLSVTPKAGYLFFVKANEDATFTATAQRMRPKGKPLRVDGKVKAYLGTGVKFPGINLANAASYKFTVKVAAALNPARTATLTP